MAIRPGDRLPQVDFVTTPDGLDTRSTADVFGGRRVVPGAFTPTRDRNHLPGFVEHADAIPFEVSGAAVGGGVEGSRPLSLAPE